MSLHVDHYENESEVEESYFVSMTDIMVGMVFVFIILLMYFVFRIQDPGEKKIPLSEHTAVVAERDKALSDLRTAGLRIRTLEKEIERLKNNDLDQYLKTADRDRQKLLDDLKKIMEEAGFKDVEVIPDQGILRLPESVLFKIGQSTIDPGSSAEKAIKALAAGLYRVLPCFGLGPESRRNKSCNPNATFIDTVLIEGHTDSSPIMRRPRPPPSPSAPGGSFLDRLTGNVQPPTPPTSAEPGAKDNLDLSAQRATNAVRDLYKYEPKLLGVFSVVPSQKDQQLGQGSSPLLNAAAFGETRPVFPNSSEDGKKANRRVDLRLLMYSPRTENLETVRRLLER